MTTTILLAEERIQALRARLEAAGFEFRELQHAHFQARGKGVVVNAYKSGKVVVQGKGEADFLEAHDLAAPPPVKLEEPVCGSDESGKGDYFGPLVVAAVVAGPVEAEQLEKIGVRDCKRMSDKRILEVAFAVRMVCPQHSVRVLAPEEYNELHEKEGNVALFLSRMHAKAIARAVRNAPACTAVVVDQFTFADRLRKAIEEEGVELPVEIRHRAEDNPAVAAASVLARGEFLLGLRDLGNEHGVLLPKGAGPQVESVARKLHREGGGLEVLRSVAKVHFKTTKRVTGS